MPHNSNIIFVELATLTEGKPFDGLTAGEFVDMFLRKVKIKKDALKEIVTNTALAISATAEETTGEIVGLPIDVNGHDKGDAAGWIVGIELEGDVVRISPKWTDIGTDVIERGIRRFFSATIDLKNKIILGGTLTNWPATRDKEGKVLLRPIELSDSLPGVWVPELASDSLDEQVEGIRRAWNRTIDAAPSMVERAAWLVEVFDNHIIVSRDENYFQVDYKTNKEGEIEFAPETDWVQVNRQWVEALYGAIEDVRAQWKRATEVATAALKIATPDVLSTFVTNGSRSEAANLDKEGVIEMEMTKEELADLVSAAVDVELAKRAPVGETLTAELTEGDPVPVPLPADFADLINLEGMTDEVQAAMDEHYKTMAAELQSQANNSALQMIADIRHKDVVVNFSNRVVNGTEDVPHGVAVDAVELQTFLLSLDKPAARQVMETIEQIWKRGFIEFAELGHGKKGDVTELLALPEEYASALDTGELSIEAFHRQAPTLGITPSDYDLTKWQGENKDE